VKQARQGDIAAKPARPQLGSHRIEYGETGICRAG
jgi:hypothetical protein